MKETINNLKKVYQYGKNNKKSLILEIVGSIFGIAIGIALPILSANQLVYLTDNLWWQLIGMSVVLLVVGLISAAKTVLIRKNTQQLTIGITKNLQMNLCNEILKLTQADLDNNSSGLFVNRLSSDIGELANMFTVGVGRVVGLVSSIGTFISIFIINYKIGIFYLCCAVILTILHLIKSSKVKQKDKEKRKQNEKTSGLSNELVRGSKDIKMLNARDTFMDQLKDNIKENNRLYLEMRNIDINYNFVIESLSSIFEFIIIIVLIALIMKNELSVAMAIALFSYRHTVMVNFMSKISELFEETNSFNLSCSRVFALIDNIEFDKEEFGDKHIDDIKGSFEFKNVKFGYNVDQYVLKDLSFKIKENSTVAFVGPSGVGKSTIFSLLCKMYNVNEGEILIDGININDLDEESIRGNITIISQNPYIFNMSIKDNLRLVKENLTDDEIVEACKLACLDDFIVELPHGYDTIVGEGGVTLSGGQRQRLAIARAFVQQTKIILFDEATSALDNETQSKIQDAINNMKKDYTILIIAHRMSTVINSDKIFVMSNGKIVDSGSHEELLKSSRTYKKLYESEFKKNK